MGLKGIRQRRETLWATAQTVPTAPPKPSNVAQKLEALQAALVSDLPVGRYKYRPDTGQVVVLDGNNIETRRYSVAEMLSGTPQQQQIMSSLTSSQYSNGRVRDQFTCFICGAEFLIERQLQDSRPCLCPRCWERANPPKKHIKDTITGDIYILVTSYPDGWAIGVDVNGVEACMPPRCYEPFDITKPPRPSPSSGKTIWK